MRLPRASIVVCKGYGEHRFHDELRRTTSFFAEVVEWQTRTFEGRVAQAVRVQVPPSAPNVFQQILPRRS